MTTKGVSIFCSVRDITTGEITGNTEVSGQTEDDGVTCVLGIGYLPMLDNAQPGDIKVTVHPPAIEYPTAEFVSREVDEENGLQTIVFTLPI